ncbi:YueI family protein [Alkaliphilus transvaalensis]|uniref:YueI family protein n=1 Tax=Alkaliphilus transvaalensis TaxID=114628 RepID=UPI00047AC616|nr:YueI family protein [Alkaliphilus transvaalensis]
MPEQDELKKILDFALNGTPELKREEKKIWLGEFRERVIMGLPMEQVLTEDALPYVEEALGDPMAEMLIVNNRIPMGHMGKYMQLAKKMNKEYKSIAVDHKEAMGVVVASRRAVDREEVVPEIKMLPEKFRGLHHNKLCPQHLEELEKAAPMYLDQFKKVTFGDKMMGIKCAICQHESDGGVLM